VLVLFKAPCAGGEGEERFDELFLLLADLRMDG
jgi:hypothetical protein